MVVGMVVVLVVGMVLGMVVIPEPVVSVDRAVELVCGGWCVCEGGGDQVHVRNKANSSFD